MTAMLQKKICMLGGFSVGKTSLVKRYVHSVFSETYLTTVGVKIDKKTVTLPDRIVNLILWADTFDRWRHVATTSSMLVAHGKVERQGDVIYVVPDRLEPLSLMSVPAMSRDFH